MENIVNDVVVAVKDIALSNGPIISFIIGILIIVLESMIPALPLSVFITLNIIVFGNISGYFISLFATILGCTLSFWIFRKGFRTFFYRKIENKINMKKLVKKITNIDLSNLTLIIAMPFTPAFLVNIAAGLSKISYKKFLLALIIGKTFMVYFWGFVGSTLVESFTDIKVVIEIIIFMVIAYVLSKLINKKFEIG